MNDDLMNNSTSQHEGANERSQSLSLFNVAKHAKHTLVPISPSPAFRARLRDGLMMAAYHQQAHQMLAEKRSEPTWGWLIGAAAIGSAAGIIAFVLRLSAHNQRITPDTAVRSS